MHGWLCLALIAINGAQQCADLRRIGIRGVVFHLGCHQCAAQIAGRVRRNARIAIAWRNTALANCRARRALSRLPLASILRSAARMSAGSMSAIGRRPIAGLIRDSRKSAFLAVAGARAALPVAFPLGDILGCDCIEGIVCARQCPHLGAPLFA